MKTEFTDVCETQKTITIEIPSEVVDAEINRIAKGYTKQARLPGFRPGKVPTTVVKQRFRDQILHDVMHDLIPRPWKKRCRSAASSPSTRPTSRTSTLEEGQPLKFTAAIETVPPFDPGDLSTISLHAHVAAITDDAVEQTLRASARARGASYEPVEGRPVADGDTVVARHRAARTRTAKTDTHETSPRAGRAAQPAGLRREAGRA